MYNMLDLKRVFSTFQETVRSLLKNKNVMRYVLKLVISVVCFKNDGKVFQRLGAAATKDLSLHSLLYLFYV